MNPNQLNKHFKIIKDVKKIINQNIDEYEAAIKADSDEIEEIKKVRSENLGGQMYDEANV